MSAKYKYFILLVVVAAVMAVLFLPGSELFSGVETVTGEPDPGDFVPDDKPYTAFTEAVQEQKPVVLEFYARW